MSKFIIIGNRFSQYSNIEDLLQKHGMQPVSPSKRELLTPKEISTLLQKVSYRQPVDLNTHQGKKLISKKEHRQARAISQISEGHTINPVWNGLYLDLVLANLDKELFGWCDPEAIKVLDYWAEVDQDIKFIFVYDHPKEVFLSDLKRSQEINESSSLEVDLQEWSDFNRDLLSFYRRYRSRSVLLCGQQVLDNVNMTLHKVSYAFKTPLLEASIESASVSTESIEPEKADSATSSSLENLVIHHVLSGHKEIEELYQALQENATLANEQDTVALTYLSQSSLAIWQDYAYQKNTLNQQSAELKENYQQVQQLTQEKEALASDQKALQQQLIVTQQTLEQTVQSSEQKLNIAHTDNKKLTEQINASRADNQKLKEQINVSQKALQEANTQQQQLKQEKDKLTQDNKALISQKDKLTQENKTLAEQKAQSDKQTQALGQQLLAVQQSLEQLYAQKEQLSLEMNKTTKEQKTLEQQLHQVQLALERAHLTNQHLQAQLPEKLWGAGTRVREQLNYMIGSKLIQHSRSVGGWLTMVFAPWGAYRQYKHEGLDTKYQEFPPLKYYEDYHMVQRYQRHLSYRLGQTYLNHIKNPLKWFTMPFSLWNDVKDFRNSKKQH